MRRSYHLPRRCKDHGQDKINRKIAMGRVYVALLDVLPLRHWRSKVLMLSQSNTAKIQPKLQSIISSNALYPTWV